MWTPKFNRFIWAIYLGRRWREIENNFRPEFASSKLCGAMFRYQKVFLVQDPMDGTWIVLRHLWVAGNYQEWMSRTHLLCPATAGRLTWGSGKNGCPKRPKWSEKTHQLMIWGCHTTQNYFGDFGGWSYAGIFRQVRETARKIDRLLLC